MECFQFDLGWYISIHMYPCLEKNYFREYWARIIINIWCLPEGFINSYFSSELLAVTLFKRCCVQIEPGLCKSHISRDRFSSDVTHMVLFELVEWKLLGNVYIVPLCITHSKASLDFWCTCKVIKNFKKVKYGNGIKFLFMNALFLIKNFKRVYTKDQ